VLTPSEWLLVLEKTKGIEVLEMKYQDVLDLNGKEYDERPSKKCG
jgi:hypothetical protein